jgi:hypothetical protein
MAAGHACLSAAQGPLRDREGDIVDAMTQLLIHVSRLALL